MNDRCDICKQVLNVPGLVCTEDCGGTCLLCMAEAGDPDCIAAIEADRNAKVSSTTQTKE